MGFAERERQKDIEEMAEEIDKMPKRPSGQTEYDVEKMGKIRVARTENESDAEKAGAFILEILLRVESMGGAGGTHSEQAIYKGINGIIMASQTTAAGGYLGPVYAEKFRLVMTDQNILNRVARSYWWGDDY